MQTSYLVEVLKSISQKHRSSEMKSPLTGIITAGTPRCRVTVECLLSGRKNALKSVNCYKSESSFKEGKKILSYFSISQLRISENSAIQVPYLLKDKPFQVSILLTSPVHRTLLALVTPQTLRLSCWTLSSKKMYLEDDQWEKRDREKMMLIIALKFEDTSCQPSLSNYPH